MLNVVGGSKNFGADNDLECESYRRLASRGNGGTHAVWGPCLADADATANEPWRGFLEPYE